VHTEPPPSTGPANAYWTDIDLPEPGDWIPTRTVSVVITYYQAPEALDITLAAIGQQTYPQALTEIVIVDDGSEPPLAEVRSPGDLPVKVVHQDDRGFGLARARNTGAAAASGDIVVFLDCDMVPEPSWLDAHARWHHLIPDALSLGFRRHVDFAGIQPAAVEEAASRGDVGVLFEGRQQERPEWIEFHMSRTRDLTTGDDDLFRIVTGGNLGIRADTLAAIGGYDESFTQWGAEDTEFGYRAFTFGAQLIPERRALCWHQGLGNVPDSGEAASLDEQRAKIAHLIADPTFRRWAPGRSYLVPYAVVEIDASGAAAKEIERCVEGVLANRFHDLVVLLSVPDDHPEATLILRKFDGDPRVVSASGDTLQVAPVRIELPVGVVMGDRSIGRIVQLLKGVGELQIPVPGVGSVVAGKTRARRSAERCADPGLIARRYGSATASWRDVGLRGGTTRGRFSRFATRFRDDSAAGKVLRRLRRVRSKEDAGALLRWISAGIRHRLTRDRFAADRRSVSHGDGRPPTTGRLGGWINGYRVVTTGVSILPNAAALQGGDLPPGRVDLVLTDEEPADRLISSADEAGAAIVRVAGPMMVPAFDERLVNPVGFGPVTSSQFGALRSNDSAVGRWLERFDGDKVDLDRTPGLPDGADRRLRRLRFVADHPAMHPSQVSRAAYLAARCGAGVPVAAVDLAELDGLVERALLVALESVVPERLVDPVYRELASIGLRRAALLEHSQSATLRRLLALAGRIVEPPLVSVVLATNRAEFVAHSLDQIGEQDYPRLEVILALHGAVSGEAVDRAGERVSKLLQLPAEMPFGEVLNAATGAATGDLVAKMDDDDWYGSHHITDLVLAREYSGATLIGKGAEFVYLAGADRTIRRFVGGAESSSATLAGGCLLIRRTDLVDVGSWRSVKKSVDQGLIEDVSRAGGSIYRTHGFEYVLNRHGTNHTWDSGDQYFSDQAENSWDGLRLDVAGIYPAG
jgi:glycosyltransferase involved in cell wall biosynthesis